MHSGGSSIDEEGILSAQQPKAVEGVERNEWKLWQTERSSSRRCILSFICNIRRRYFVDGNEFCKQEELQQEACAVQE